MTISLPFLLFTFIFYACFPKLLNVHFKCLMSYTFSLIIFYVGTIVNSFNLAEPPSKICDLIGYQVFIGMALCFFWLSILCYEICSSFKTQKRTTYQDHRKFKKYCIYAFGILGALELIVFLIDSTSFIPFDYRPGMGMNRCWFIYSEDSKIVESIYVYIPRSIILTANIILYTITAYKITKLKKHRLTMDQQESQTMDADNADNDQFFIYLKLFLLLGICWIAESISFFIGQNYIFYVTDFLNCLQGVIIFYFFVWNKNVRKMIVISNRGPRNEYDLM